MNKKILNEMLNIEKNHRYTCKQCNETLLAIKMLLDEMFEYTIFYKILGT